NFVIRQRVEQLNQIFELGQLLQTDVDPGVMLDAIAYSIVQSVGFDVVVITMIDPETGLLRRKTQAGLPVDIFERSKADVISMDALKSVLKENLKISESYFYPIEAILEMEIAGLDALSAAYAGNRTMHSEGPDAWRDGDMLLVPISGAGGELLGIISLDRPQYNKRPQRSKIEILEIFAHQAATTIENNRLYLNSVRNAEQEARLNELMEQVTRTLDIDQIIESMAHNALRLAPFTHLDIALRDDESGYILTHVQVTNDDTLISSREKKASLEHTALGRTVKSNADYVYTIQNDIAAYKDLSEWYEKGERVSLILPLSAGGETLGAVHFGSNNTYEFNVDEFRVMLNRISNMTAVAIQNAQLFNRAVNLQIFNESIVESIQQGIVVLDRSGRVISANQFMKYEYDWDITDGTGRRDIFDYSPDLATPLAEPLRGVLETGEPDQLMNVRTPYGRSFVVRNFYMYPLMSHDLVDGAVLLIEDSTERAMLEENVQERANQLAALTRASGRITSSLQLDQVIELALETMEQVVEYDTITIWRRIADDTMQLVGVRGASIEMTPAIRATISEVIRMKQIVDTR
ncbi:MAG: GAF domain-containing protein, partial [Chloroflexota bacterium]